jgi:hypothetical protein
VNEQLAKERGPIRRKRSRRRSDRERQELDQIAMSRWNKAEEKGKIIRINANQYYYDYR